MSGPLTNPRNRVIPIKQTNESPNPLTDLHGAGVVFNTVDDYMLTIDPQCIGTQVDVINGGFYMFLACDALNSTVFLPSEGKVSLISKGSDLMIPDFSAQGGE
jgi:hypothetical protein